MKDRMNGANVDQWEHWTKAGLLVPGVEERSEIDARALDGSVINIAVQSIQINRGRQTLHAPLPSEAGKLPKIIPQVPKRTS